MSLDPDRCYAAVQSRDRRFDGRFVTAVRTTGIYCRPSCPAITPKRGNVEFHPTAAAAQQRGFRACKRCAPDATPGSPEWNIRHDVVGRAMRLIADGEIDRVGVTGLARRLGYSDRHLTRVFNDELGAGPLAVARAHRAHTARLLVETTDLCFTDIAFASGFGSVRQFNDTIREVYASTPRDLRRAAPTAPDGGAMASTVRLRLPTRVPHSTAATLGFLGRRAIAGLEAWDGVTYRRALRLPGGHGVLAVCAGASDDHVVAELSIEAWSDLPAAVQRVRRMLDLDADPHAVDAHLSADAALAPLVRAAPGRRSVGSVDPFETAVRAVIGQQVSVAGARRVAGDLLAQIGEPLRVADDQLTVVFPVAAEVAAAADTSDTTFPMPTSRRATIGRLAATVADGRVALDVGADPAEARARLLELRGIGPWTADYVAMRGLGHPDVLLDSDLIVRRAIDALNTADPRRWSPWSSYATHHLWASHAASTQQQSSCTSRGQNTD
ncbi:MAG: DNA-3-methyladenine glycosylase 2 family protein [Ilumatobacteraceae bacterium]|nr:DNA-3-methyladenine glycosylase 2 family protein [Ilumatobacteraceae bacterium]